MPRRLQPLAACLSIAALLAVSSCSASSTEFGQMEPSIVSMEQAEQLSVMRLNNYELGIARFTMSLPDKGRQAWLQGRVDLVEHTGYANMTTNGAGNAYSLLVWTENQIAELPAQNTELPTQPPASRAWSLRDLDPHAGLPDSALNFLLQLASDRPENALLLRQNGAQYHGQTVIEGQEVSVYTGPGTNHKPSDNITYFVSSDARLMKVEARLGDSSNPVVINFEGAEETPIELPALGNSSK